MLSRLLLAILFITGLYLYSFPQTYRYEDYIYYDNIKTVLFQKSGSQNSYPVLDLNNPKMLCRLLLMTLIAAINLYNIQLYIVKMIGLKVTC